MSVFECPICHQALPQAEHSLVCPCRHTFDVARQGYVNLLTKKPDNLYEDKALFQARRAVYEAGFFGQVVEAVEAALPAQGLLLDAGCGEGSLLAALLERGGRRTGVGLDIAKPAVQMAAAAFKQAAWCVADLCNIPLAQGSVAGIANVLTPANYTQFERVLAPGGVLVKVVPNAGHLLEIRSATGKSPYTQELDQTLAVFERQFAVEAVQAVRYEFPCTEALAEQVFTMTPMTAHDTWQGIASGRITVDVTVITGKVRHG